MTELCGVIPSRPADERDDAGCGETCEDPHWPAQLPGVPLCWRCCEEAGLCKDDEEDWP